MVIISVENEISKKVDFKNTIGEFVASKANRAHFPFCLRH